MKPSSLIKSKCKTQKEQLEVLYTIVDQFLGSQEALWAIQCNKQEVLPKRLKKPIKAIVVGK